MISSRLIRLTALLLSGVYLCDGLLVGLAHNHALGGLGHDHAAAADHAHAAQAGEHRECHTHPHRCCHSTSANEAPPNENEHRSAGESHPTHDPHHHHSDDCAACRYLALATLPVFHLSLPQVDEIGSSTVSLPAAAPVARPAGSHQARAPPLA